MSDLNPYEEGLAIDLAKAEDCNATLTEQLEAARRDAKEAEAYAVQMEVMLESAEQQGYANAMEAERKLHGKRIGELEAKLAKAVEALEHAKLNMPHPDQMIDDTLAELKGEKEALFEIKRHRGIEE